MNAWLAKIFGEEMALVLPYFVVISFSLCIALLWINKRTSQKNMSVATAMDVSLAVMIFGFIGARLFHVVFEEPDLYRQDPMQVLRVWQGGFVWFGGAIAGAFAGMWVLARKQEALGPWLDLFAPVGAIGYAIGRVACFIQGCCYGRFYMIGSYHFQFPTQLFAIVWETTAAIILLKIEARPLAKHPGSIFCLWLIMHGLGRFIMEIFRADERGPTYGFVTVSMFIGVCLISTGIFFLQRMNSRS